MAEIELRHSETRYRNLSTDLELLVFQRTKELAAINKELEASNEEYVALNEELEEANGLLLRSNNNQQQFAYLERMQLAASRMPTLIKDLLDYSRINTQRDLTASVSLPEIIDRALVSLELVIKDTGATISTGPLPNVQGDASQLDQLFQSLIGNALKFRRKDVAPVIQINAYSIERSQLPASAKPIRATGQYYRIDVADNGVGFDEKYLDRIFQVLQRLYGRSEYAGTGIGLPICEKVVANHGGAVNATSKPGQGATCSVYLTIDE
ncbi:ATP-binding protein [Spirosoma sp.]|uniref:sensor histidine kinase n=1 Tax=Spirosoma sp. TaxID=1899569 RepID=UPI00261E58A7|nr:ATP-binding protein [Spirosoma sp.]MCX6215265.1 ATP-binding protein [Spirosoma sp.]